MIISFYLTHVEMRARRVIFVSICLLLFLYAHSSSKLHSQYVELISNHQENTPVVILETTQDEFRERYETKTRQLPLPSSATFTDFLSWYSELHDDVDLHKNR
jgi:RNase adaptor protein for sRNA GlmZ degradation